MEGRDNISAVSELLREELTNKKATIQRYKEINKKLNNNSNKLSDTLYSIPDATKLYVNMNNFEENMNKYNQCLQVKYKNQSRECMQIKLENQSIKQMNNELKKEIGNLSEKLKGEMEGKNKVIEEIRWIKINLIAII